MRQASWEELFREGEVRPPRVSPWTHVARFFPFSWEDIVTFTIVLIAFLTVVQSIDGANWVAEMPDLYTIAFLGLLLGTVLAKMRIPEWLAHLVAIPLGAVGVVLTATSKVAEGSAVDRTRELADRMQLWFDAIVSGGISNDNLPFVLLVVSLTFLLAYLAAWSIFRWYNAWLGLIPGGLALLTNISYLPGQKSAPLIIYLFAAILLVARINVLRGERQWRRERTGYPDLISLHVLNVTVWVALGLLAFAWILPVKTGGGVLYVFWRDVTSPIAEPFSGLGRVFSAIDSKRGGTVHRFGSTLPLQGEISLGGGEVMTVSATETGFLRAQSYDFYTAQGWKVGPSAQITSSNWPALRAMQGPEEARRQLRRPVSLQVTPSRKSNVVVSNGQPLTVNIDTRVVFGADASDIASVRPAGTLDKGEQYRVESTVSNASVPRLRAAPTIYPPWVAPYLQLPADLPTQIQGKALEVTRGANNSFDKATEIEKFLRAYVVDTKIPPAPAKRDSVAYFLFDIGRGYFDYHASAMVVMLRTLGIPARLAVGYTVRPADRIPDTNVYVVTEANSFAWPEVYFPSLGWVEFNPAPNEPRITRSGDDQDIVGGSDEPFLDEDLFGLELPDTTGDAAEALDALEIDEGSSLVGNIIATVVLGLLGITALGAVVFQYSWRRGLAGQPYAVQVWEKTMRLSGWARIRTLPQETPRELVYRLERELPEVEDIDYLGEAFVRARYGQKELAPGERERLQGVWKNARNTLLARMLRWK